MILQILRKLKLLQNFELQEQNLTSKDALATKD